MKLRSKRVHATAAATDDRHRPITLCLGPGLGFDMDVDEARTLALALADAIIENRRRAADPAIARANDLPGL